MARRPPTTSDLHGNRDFWILLDRCWIVVEGAVLLDGMLSRGDELLDSLQHGYSVEVKVEHRHKSLGWTSLISIPGIIVLPVGSVLAFAGFVCGVIALPSIAASHGRQQGTWMAFFACAVFVFNFVLVYVLVGLT